MFRLDLALLVEEVVGKVLVEIDGSSGTRLSLAGKQRGDVERSDGVVPSSKFSCHGRS